MKLRFKTNYKSIENIDSINLPKFTVLTGANGSGKSQLLEAIKNGSIEVESIESSEISLFNYESYRLNNESAFNYQQIKNEKQSLLQLFNQHVKSNILNYYSRINLFKQQDIARINVEKPWYEITENDLSFFNQDIIPSEYISELSEFKKFIDEHFKNSGALKSNLNARLIHKDALQNSNFSVEVVEVSFESSLESAKVSNF